MSCTGFVTKVAPFGLHVSFYGNVFGLLPAKALTRHGIHDPSEAFSSGQVRSFPMMPRFPFLMTMKNFSH